MWDLSEDTNRILAYEQIRPWEWVVFYWFINQGHGKVTSRSFQARSRKNIENTHFLSKPIGSEVIY